MSEKKLNADDMNMDMMLADALLRITALEKLLLEKGLFTKEELKATTDVLVEKITKVVMDRVASSKNLDDFISALGNTDKKELKN